MREFDIFGICYITELFIRNFPLYFVFACLIYFLKHCQGFSFITPENAKLEPVKEYRQQLARVRQLVYAGRKEIQFKLYLKIWNLILL